MFFLMWGYSWLCCTISISHLTCCYIGCSCRVGCCLVHAFRCCCPLLQISFIPRRAIWSCGVLQIVRLVCSRSDIQTISASDEQNRTWGIEAFLWEPWEGLVDSRFLRLSRVNPSVFLTVLGVTVTLYTLRTGDCLLRTVAGYSVGGLAPQPAISRRFSCFQ